VSTGIRFPDLRMDPTRAGFGVRLRVLPAVALTGVSVLVPTVLLAYLWRDSRRWNLFRITLGPPPLFWAGLAGLIAIGVAWYCRTRPGKAFSFPRVWPLLLTAAAAYLCVEGFLLRADPPGWLHATSFAAFCSACVLPFRLVRAQALERIIQWISVAVLLFVLPPSLAGVVLAAAHMIAQSEARVAQRIAALENSSAVLGKVGVREWSRVQPRTITSQLMALQSAIRAIEWPDRDLIRTAAYLGQKQRDELGAAAEEALRAAVAAVQCEGAEQVLQTKPAAVEDVRAISPAFSTRLTARQGYCIEAYKALWPKLDEAREVRSQFPPFASAADEMRAALEQRAGELSSAWGTAWIGDAMLRGGTRPSDAATLLNTKIASVPSAEAVALADIAEYARMPFARARSMGDNRNTCVSFTATYSSSTRHQSVVVCRLFAGPDAKVAAEMELIYRGGDARTHYDRTLERDITVYPAIQMSAPPDRLVLRGRESSPGEFMTALEQAVSEKVETQTRGPGLKVPDDGFRFGPKGLFEVVPTGKVRLAGGATGVGVTIYFRR
jgi:hypothetical protein